MKEKFTQGDWVASDYLVRCNGQRVSECGYSGVEHDEQELANANLIAEAPDMYRMLSEISAFLSFKPDNDSLHGLKGDIEKLLTKARGESDGN